MTDAPFTLTARWLLPISAPPLERGSLTIAAGRIVAVEPHGARRADLDLGDSAILPGLVNAHTHLDLGGLRGAVPFQGHFEEWLRAVIQHRRARSVEQVEADIRAGLAESVRFGTTLLGDIAGGGLSWPVLASAPVRAVVFHELLGVPADRAERALSTARAWLQAHRATPTCRPGLSPHAPYSVSARLFKEAGMLAGREGAALAVHLAETEAELELLAHRRGPLVAFLEELGVWAPEELIDGPQSVINLCNQGAPTLLVHGNYLAASTVVPARSSVIYCPRTHAFFRHPAHPFRDLAERGVRIALGTDSLASNPDLDVLAEARVVHRLCPDVAPASVLRMATLAGAEALGWADETGSLEVGKSADLVVVPLPAIAEEGPEGAFLASGAPVERVMCRGRWIAPC
jgi:cytosine/adenosine deaminase-related metal-dependent hydrolase